MVRTRHSLPAAHDSDDDFLPAHTESGEVPKWMRELKIDGRERLHGEKKTGGGMGVYTWRGAVYQIDENTPREWIEAEANREKKRKKKKQQPPEKPDAPACESSDANRDVTQRQPREDQEMLASDQQELRARESVGRQEPPESESVGGKEPSMERQERQRQSTTKKRQMDEVEAELRVSKKPRKSVNSLRDKSTPPQRHYLFPTLHVKKKKRVRRTKEQMEAARREAEERGRKEASQQTVESTEGAGDVAMPGASADINEAAGSVNVGVRSEEQTWQSGHETASTNRGSQETVPEEVVGERPGANLPPQTQQRSASRSTQTPELPDMPQSFPMPITKQDMHTLSRIVCTITEPEANRLAATIVEIGRINSHAREQKARSEGLIEILTKWKEMLSAQQKPDAEKRHQQAPLPDSPMADQLSPPAEVDPPTEADPPTAVEVDPPTAISRMPSLTHDDPSELSGSSPDSFELNNAPSHGPLPVASRPPQTESWPLAPQKAPSLELASSHHHDTDQAAPVEGTPVCQSQVKGETESDRRSKILRELAILESLPSLLDNLPGAPSGTM